LGAAEVLRYKNVEVPRQPGEVGRLRVIKGPDQGLVYVMKSSSVTFGRGEEANVMISDLKASRSHARLDYTTEGWVMNDLGSANGILFQGEYVRKFSLNSGEHFTVGETIFEFFTHSESTRVLTAPLRLASEVQEQDHAFMAQRLKVKGLAQGATVEAPPAGTKSTQARTLLLIAAVGGVYYYMNFMDDPKPRAPIAATKPEKSEAEQALSSYLPATVNKEVGKTAEQYYRQGFREYREGNYLRAKAQFELALQVNPSHEMARHYLMSADKEMEDATHGLMRSAQKAIVAGRLREAKGDYETAMRLMYYDRSNPDFIECEEALKKVDEELTRTQQ
jgi:pSer/pThr/pTyr-binding forkhead associated (FHA) protein